MNTKKLLKIVEKTTNMDRKKFGSMGDLIKLKTAYEILKVKRDMKKLRKENERTEHQIVRGCRSTRQKNRSQNTGDLA